MAVKDRIEVETDWYDLICQELDDLREDVRTSACDEDQPVAPHEDLFDFVKKDLEKIRQVTGFGKNVPDPLLWLGPEGQIGLTWKFKSKNASVDLVYGRKFFARKTIDSIQEVFDPRQIASALASLAG